MPANHSFELPVEWTKVAQRDLRTLDKRVVQTIMKAVTRYVGHGHGDIRLVHSGVRDSAGHRELALRVGDYRVFLHVGKAGVQVEHVRNRNVAYRG